MRNDDRASVREDRGFEYFPWANNGTREVSDTRHVNSDEIVLCGEHQDDQLLSVAETKEVFGNFCRFCRTTNQSLRLVGLSDELHPNHRKLWM